jgi:hypothetical protein
MLVLDRVRFSRLGACSIELLAKREFLKRWSVSVAIVEAARNCRRPRVSVLHASVFGSGLFDLGSA